MAKKKNQRSASHFYENDEEELLNLQKKSKSSHSASKCVMRARKMKVDTARADETESKFSEEEVSSEPESQQAGQFTVNRARRPQQPWETDPRWMELRIQGQRLFLKKVALMIEQLDLIKELVKNRADKKLP